MQKELMIASIMHFLRYTCKDEWAPGSIFDNKSREWIAVFNELVEKGWIIRKRTYHGYQYKWAARFPDGM